MNKAVRENQALRAASEAVKLMALSQGVHCKMDLSKDFYVNKCSEKTPDEIANMKGELASLQWKRILAFLKHVQQGIKPSACLKELPENEETAFIKELREAKIRYDKEANTTDIVTWFTRNVFNLHEDDILHFRDSFAYFIKAGNKPSPLPPDCTILANQTNTDFGRFFTYLEKPDIMLKYIFNIWDYSDPRNVAYAIHNKLSTNINNISILFIDKEIIRRSSENGFATIKIDPEPNIDDHTFEEYIDTVYVYTTAPISLLTQSVFVLPGSNLGLENINIIHDIFKGKYEVIDIHPWLLYLIQVNPIKYFFTDSLFGGNMAPPLKFKLAYYIVAHYVATHDPAYKSNPSVFYKLPDSEKIPKMIAALQKNKCIQDDLLTAGYRWLNRESVKEVRPSMKELIASQIGTSGSSLLNRIAKGGKRRTRKVRFTNL